MTKYLINVLLLTTMLLFVKTNLQAANYFWNGGTGDWSVGANWSDITGTIPFTVPPGPADNVIIKNGANYNIGQGDVITLNIGTYTIRNFKIIGFPDLSNKPKLLFKGEFGVGEVLLYVRKNIILDPNFRIKYQESGYNKWILKGSNNHIVNSKGRNLDYLIVDTLNIKTTIIDSIKAKTKIQLKEGIFYGDGVKIITGVFLAWDGCIGLNCKDKTVDLINGSSIDCREFSANNNYQSDSYSGNFLIDCHMFKGGNETVFEASVYLRDSFPSNSSSFLYNLFGNGITINDLTIDSDTRVKIAGQITVNDFTVVQPYSIIVFDLGSTYQPDDSRDYTFVINGNASTAPPSASACPVLTEMYTQLGSLVKMEFIKNGGSLTFDHIRIQGIGTSGTATFNVTNGIVEDYADDWDNITGVPSIDYFWVGNTGDWDDPGNWATSSGGTGGASCVPTLFDDVYFDSQSFSGINHTVTINAAIENTCRHLEWTNTGNNKIAFSNPVDLVYYPLLYVAGDLLLRDGMTVIDSSGRAEFILVGTGDFDFDAPNIVLPYLTFRNGSGKWTVLRNTNCTSIELAGGTLNLGDKDFTIEKLWAPSGKVPKFFELTSSTIDATEKIDFGIFSNNHTVDAGTSYMKTPKFVAEHGTYYDLHLTNTVNETLSSRKYKFRKLILDSEFNLLTADSLTVDSLIFKKDNGSLEINIKEEAWAGSDTIGIIVKEGIRSYAPGTGNYPKIYSNLDGSQATLVYFNNLCIEGKLSIKDIEARGVGKVHVPEGISEGGNSNFDFTPMPIYEGVLYWIGGQGGWSGKENWSTGSASCPADLFPAGADSLIFDNFSTTIGDTVFLPSSKTANTLVMRNNDPANTTIFLLGLNLKLLHSLVIDGGNFEVVDDTNTGSPASIWVDKEVSITNGANLTLDNATIYACRRPVLSTETTFFMDGTSSLNGTNSTISIMGHSSQPGQKTLEIDENASGDMTDIKFEIRKAINGQNDYHMDFQFGGHEIKSLIFNNSTPNLANGDLQEYRILEDVLTTTTTINYGKVIVKNGSTIYTDY